jgi:hypothetical protein
MVDTLSFKGTSIVHIILTGIDNIQEKYCLVLRY